MHCVIFDSAIGCAFQRGRKSGLIEGSGVCALGGIDKDKGHPIRVSVAVPKAPIVHPLRPHNTLIGEGIDVIAHKSLGGGVVLGGVLAGLLCQRSYEAKAKSRKSKSSSSQLGLAGVKHSGVPLVLSDYFQKMTETGSIHLHDIRRDAILYWQRDSRTRSDCQL
jgi:hypothetical protein